LIALAGAFSLELQNYNLALCVGLTGTLLTIIVGCLVLSDRRSRDANLDILDQYARQESLPKIRLKGPDRHGLWHLVSFVGSHRGLIFIIVVLGIFDALLVPVMNAFPSWFVLKHFP
jgi:hypothetical protein